jgi:hypothetical protein
MRLLMTSAVAGILLSVSAMSLAACPPDGQTRETLRALKESQWQITDAQQRQQSALSLLDCFANPEPHFGCAPNYLLPRPSSSFGNDY